MAEHAPLLPPNATAFERAAAIAFGRVSDVPAPLSDIWDPWSCPPALLPWLAWALSIDDWNPKWDRTRRRTAVANAIVDQRRKGSAAAVDAALARFDAGLSLVEWFEQSPAGEPHTFEIRVPTDGGGLDNDLAEAIVDAVDRAKPLRSHFVLSQVLGSAGRISILAAARAFATRRLAFNGALPA